MLNGLEVFPSLRSFLASCGKLGKTTKIPYEEFSEGVNLGVVGGEAVCGPTEAPMEEQKETGKRVPSSVTDLRAARESRANEVRAQQKRWWRWQQTSAAGFQSTGRRETGMG